MFGVTALMKFAAWDKCDLIDLLLPFLTTSDVNLTSPQNMFTALHHAADMGAGRTFKRLFEESLMDKSLLDSKGRSGLEIANANGISIPNP